MYILKNAQCYIFKVVFCVYSINNNLFVVILVIIFNVICYTVFYNINGVIYNCYIQIATFRIYWCDSLILFVYYRVIYFYIVVERFFVV